MIHLVISPLQSFIALLPIICHFLDSPRLKFEVIERNLPENFFSIVDEWFRRENLLLNDVFHLKTANFGPTFEDFSVSLPFFFSPIDLVLSNMTKDGESLKNSYSSRNYAASEEVWEESVTIVNELPYRWSCHLDRMVDKKSIFRVAEWFSMVG